MTGDKIERKLVEGEITVDYSLDFGNYPTVPNISPATPKECADAMKLLRKKLNDHVSWSHYGIPFAYIKCRREVAHEVRKQLVQRGHNEDFILCRLNGKEGEDCFKSSCNYLELGDLLPRKTSCTGITHLTKSIIRRNLWKIHFKSY